MVLARILLGLICCSKMIRGGGAKAMIWSLGDLRESNTAQHSINRGSYANMDVVNSSRKIRSCLDVDSFPIREHGRPITLPLCTALTTARYIRGIGCHLPVHTLIIKPHTIRTRPRVLVYPVLADASAISLVFPGTNQAPRIG